MFSLDMLISKRRTFSGLILVLKILKDFILPESYHSQIITINSTSSKTTMTIPLGIYFYTGVSLIAQLIKNPPAMQEAPDLIPWSGKFTGKGIGYPLQYSWASLVAQLESTCHVGDLGLIPGREDPLEKGKATRASILTWRIPWTIQS